MVSFGVPKTLEATIRALMLAALVAPCTGHTQRAGLGFEPGASDSLREDLARLREEPQRSAPSTDDLIDRFSPPPFDADAADAHEQIIERILEEQQRNGPQSEYLIGLFSSLGLLYEENEDHALAAAAIDRSRQVLRVNYGLHRLDEAPLIRQAIRNEEARGDFSAAWELEQELLALLRRHGGDLRTVPLHHEIGDKRMDVLKRYVAGEFPPQLTLGCYYNPSREDIGSCYSGSRGKAVRAILSEALQSYQAAIRALLRHGRYSSEELRELEMKLLRNNYAHGGNYGIGREGLRRLLAYDVWVSAPLAKRTDSLVQLADWEILFSNFGAALEIYEDAYEQLDGGDVAQASIEQIFSPETPVVLPAFLPNPLASEEAPGSTGNVDVAFDITKFGKSRNVELLETTNAPKAASDDLVRVIKRSRFRPRVTGGEITNSPRLVVRHYLND